MCFSWWDSLREFISRLQRWWRGINGEGGAGGLWSPSLGWQSIAADQQVSGRKLEAISYLVDSFSSSVAPVLMLLGGLGFCLLFMVSHRFGNGSE